MSKKNNLAIVNAYNDKKYNDYMSQHNIKNIDSNDKTHTHTRMPNIDMNIYPGSFLFLKDELKNLMQEAKNLDVNYKDNKSNSAIRKFLFFNSV